MTPEQVWQSALAQLQREMPKASFDTWVSDARLVSYDEGRFTIGARNAFARDWLESRLTSTVTRLLMGIMNRDVQVEFVVFVDPNESAETTQDKDRGGEEFQPPEETERLQALARTAYAVRYDRVAQPYKRIVVDGYLARHVPEIGSRLTWLYIGAHQGAWKDGGREGAWTVRLPVSAICRYTGLSSTAAKRLLYDNSKTWEMLAGLLVRPPQEKEWKWNSKRPGKKHRLPISYVVYMTLPLTWADALAVKEWLVERRRAGLSLLDAMIEALQVKDLVGEILLPVGAQPALEEIRSKMTSRPLYVLDIARDLMGAKDADALPGDIQKVADALHTRIVKAFGTIGVTHYFVETVVPRTGISSDLAMAITLLRSRCYLNEKTAEVRNEVLVRGGYQEIADWVGIRRSRTIWEWVTGRQDRKTLADGSTWEQPQYASRKTVKGNGPGPAFIKELPPKEGDQVHWKRFAVRLLEPLFDDGSGPIGDAGSGPIQNDGNGLISDDGSGLISNDGSGPESWRKWDGINDSMTLILSLKKVQAAISSSTENRGSTAHPSSWELKTLLVKNGAYASSVRSLLNKKVRGEQFVSWLLYSFGEGLVENGYGPMNIALKALLDGPDSWPGEAYTRLAGMPPRVLLDVLAGAIKSEGKETGNRDWDNRMVKVSLARLMELKALLAGEGR